MATYREVAYNVLESYKKVHDDTTLQLSQVVFWIQVVVNRLQYENRKNTNTSRYLAVFSPITVSIDKTMKDRKYIDLPVEIMDLKNEKGIQYITYNYETGCCCTGANFSQVQFQPTSPAESMRLMFDEYEKPSSKQPYFYRVTGVNGINNVNRIYFLGLECIDVTDVEIGILASVNPASLCDLDDNIPIEDWLVEELLARVLNLGRFILVAPQELSNDGVDYTKKSVNQVPETITPKPTQQQQISAYQQKQAEQEQMQQQLDNGQ